MKEGLIEKVRQLVQQAYEAHRMDLGEARDLQPETKGLCTKKMTSKQADFLMHQNRQGA
jgi:hypothetical protein